MRIIDLSQDIYEGMKVYPGHLKTVQFEHATHEETAPRFEGGFSFQTTGFMLNDNGPTHVDSFSHLDPDPSAETIEQMPLDLFYGTAVCLDVTELQAADRHHRRGPGPGRGRGAGERAAGRHRAVPHRHLEPLRGDKRYLTEFAGLGESAARVDRQPGRSRRSAWTARPRTTRPAPATRAT